MADATTSQVLVDGARKLVMKFTNHSDTTGETSALKVDVSTLATYKGQACTGVRIDKVSYSTTMPVQIEWNATANVVALIVEGHDEFCFRDYGGVHNTAGAGKNGDIDFSTVGTLTADDTYTIVMEMTKEFPSVP